MNVDKATYAKLLQDNEHRVYWQSRDALGTVVHEWRALDDGRLLLRETDARGGKLYWVAPELVQG